MIYSGEGEREREGEKEERECTALCSQRVDLVKQQPEASFPS